MSKKKEPPLQKDLPGMPLGNVPKSVRETAEKFIAATLDLKRKKDYCNAIQDRLLIEMMRERVNVAVVVDGHRKYYVRLQTADAKLRVESGPIVPAAAGTNGKS